ncbi:hypothetical protein JW964_00055 [candidate division KSB1 bacterium]|nr:hypothetical protein [candidate division KSB1 bacterium]
MKRPHLKFSGLGSLVLLLPLMTYTLYQWFERDKDEAFIQQIYNRQLDTILFSVNQYSWNKFEFWTSAISDIHHAPDETRKRIVNLLKQNRSLIGICMLDSNGSRIFEVGRFSRIFAKNEEATEKVREKILLYQHQLKRMKRRAIEGYMRPLSLNLDDLDPSIDLILIPVASAGDSAENWIIAGLYLDKFQFIQDIVVRKFTEINDGNLIFAIQSQTGKILYNSDSETEHAFEKTDTMWILPDLQIMVKLKGTTLQSLSKQRIQKNLLFLLIINLLLGIGIVILMQNVSKAVKLARMKSDFVANVSHELRTPLALIRMYAETLEMGRIRSKEKQKRYYQTIMNECSRLSKLVNNILDFSKIESHSKKYVFQMIQPDLWLRETLSVTQFHLDQKGFALDVRIDAQVPRIKADREAITQAFTNLLDNAVKFSGDSRNIQVCLEKVNTEIHISVRDWGVGIEPADQKHIFQKFYRVGSSLIHDVKGTGLGLSLVKHIMQVHHGRIEVKSELGQGSTFSLFFPIGGI